MQNSSLREVPREQRAAVIPLKQDESSLLDWLQASGRLISRNTQETDSFLEEEEEISGLIDPDDSNYDAVEDDDDNDLVELEP